MQMAGRIERLNNSQQIALASYALARVEKGTIMRINPRSRPFELDHVEFEAFKVILRLLPARKRFAPLRKDYSGHHGRGPRDSSFFVYCRFAARLSAGCFGVSPAEIAAPTRGSRRVTRARHLAIYLAHVSFGLPLTMVATSFARDRSTAAYACRKIEDQRDAPAFDAALNDLERVTRILLGLNGKESDA